MCTAISMQLGETYFGRTLDVERPYPTAVVVAPRNFPFIGEEGGHYAIIGMAMVLHGYPLFFDAANEKGLAMAGLNFPQNADYGRWQTGMRNLPPHRLIPHILGNCATVAEAKEVFARIHITDETFDNIPNTPLHFMVSDLASSITVEQTKEGLKVYDNPVGVLTNNPPFPWHMMNLVNYLNVTEEEAENRFLKGVDLEPFCKGMGGVGLPGDLSSPSRFVRVAFAKEKALSYETKEENLCQFFHVLGTVEQTAGLARAGESFEQTLYTSAICLNEGKYFYTTYFNPQITEVDMGKTDLAGKALAVYPLRDKTAIWKE